jgi:phage tail sheath protein FI
MPTYAAPGVYYERGDAGAPAIVPLRTDIAGFVGIAERGPLHAAVPVDSWRQFQAYFGGFIGAGYLAYAARAFFENGGRRAWIVRVASSAAATAGLDLHTLAPAPAWRVDAFSEGSWGNAMSVALRPTHTAQTRLLAKHCTPDYAAVASVAGFVRGSHVRVPVAPGVMAYRVVTAVDAAALRLYWVHPDPRRRLPYEQPLAGLDPNLDVPVESIDYTALVFEGGRLRARYDGLSLVPAHPRYGPSVLAPAQRSGSAGDAYGSALPEAPDLICIRELRSPAAIASMSPLDEDAVDATALRGGVDGLSALGVRDFIGEPAGPLDDDEARRDKSLGIAALDDVAEVALLAVPDIHIQPVDPPRRQPPPACIPDPCLPPPPAPPASPRIDVAAETPPRFDDEQVYRVQAALVRHCEARGDRVALLDPPWSAVHDPRQGVAAVRAWRQRFDSAFAALYFPWVDVVDPLRGQDATTRAIPPSGHVAGFVAQTDLDVGVHKAPANGALRWLQGVSAAEDTTVHGLLNDEHINALRAFPGRGLRIFGARTLASDPDWRYLNVRRLLIMIEQAIRESCQWAVFESNDVFTRAKLHLSLTAFLMALWQRGALAGSSPRAAFYVRCDESVNPAAERAQGRLLAEVGVAPAKPYEFVVLRVGRVENQLEIADTGLRGGSD